MRKISELAGFRSPNFFKLIMDGERNITKKTLPQFQQLLKLNKEEKSFFKNLVFFNQATTHEEKNRYYQKLTQTRKFKELKLLDKDQYEFFSRWYHPIVRELVVHKDFDGHFEWISEKIYPSITSYQVRKSIELMERLGFLTKDKKGNWAQSVPVLSTGAESDEIALLTYHQSLLELSHDLVAELPAERRDISAITLGIEKNKLPLLKERIATFRREIMSLTTESTPEEVVVLSIQLLPFTKDREKEAV